MGRFIEGGTSLNFRLAKPNRDRIQDTHLSVRTAALEEAGPGGRIRKPDLRKLPTLAALLKAARSVNSRSAVVSLPTFGNTKFLFDPKLIQIY